jgi:holin-like protein
MTALRGLALLLLLQAAGEGLARAFGLPVPGPVIGLVLLLAALDHLSLLFVPVGVGVITHLDLLSRYGFQLLAVIALSTWIGLATTALVLRSLLGIEVDGEDGDG